MKLNRTLSLCLTLAVCATLAIGGTLAYYTDREQVTNTFNLSDGVDITLDESKVDSNFNKDESNRVVENTYEDIYPGAVLPKDPTIHVTGGSDPAYLRAKITVQGGASWLAVYTGEPVDVVSGFYKLFNGVNNDFSLTECTVNGNDVTYTMIYGKEAKSGDNITVFESVNFSSAFTKETIQQYFGGPGGSFKIDVIAEAIQSATFTSAVEAFAHYDGTNVQAPTTGWYDETATKLVIDSAEDLFGFAQLVNGGNSFAGKTITLGADIDLKDAKWTPIGNKNTSRFAGTFDGAGHTISNLYVNEPEAGGLFGRVWAGATVKDVTVENADITSYHYAGVIAGHTYGNITGCTVKNATINCVKGMVGSTEEDGNKAGAIVGHAASDASFSVTDNKAVNVTIFAGRDAGCIAGAGTTANVNGNTFTNVTVTANGDSTGANIANTEIGRIL